MEEYFAAPRGSLGEEPTPLEIDLAYHALKQADPYQQQAADRAMRQEIAMRPGYES